MRSLGFRLASCTLAAVVWGSSAARADWGPYTETVYVDPVADVVLPTSYIVPSSYVATTAAVIPTVYATAYYPTSYTWTPTAFYPTSYVPTGYYVSERVARRPLLSRIFGRRDSYVATTIYYPTSTVVPTTARYYAPTILEYPVIAETRYRGVATACGTCDDSVVVASAAPVERRVIRDEPAAPRANQSRGRSRVESDPVEDQDTTSSEVQPAPINPETAPRELDAIPQPKSAGTQPNKAAVPDPSAAKDSPPAPQAATPTQPEAGAVRNSDPRQNETSKSAAGSGTQSTSPEKKDVSPAPVDRDPVDAPIPLPIAPGSGLDDKGLPPVSDDKAAPETTRESLKPSYELSRRPALSLLKGRVRSSATSKPEDGVRVTLSSRTHAFEDRTAYSNDAGRFALNVPDGDWTVNVTMPSGRVYPVYRITVTGGAIIDDRGRDIPALVITR
jgi:hypothetical protein